MSDKVYIICGPTASGKTALSIHAANLLNGEIISADSMQIYRDMNIGTAKITPEESCGIPHHMINIVDPDKSFSVAEYKEQAKKVIFDIKNRGKTPIIVGGTGLYINALLYDYQFMQTSANEKLREELKELLSQKGPEYLHAILAERDPETAQNLHYNDTFRVIRALEMFNSGHIKQANEQKPVFDYVALAVNYDRNILYDRINQRVQKMFNDGLVIEVQNLIKKYNLTFDHQSMKAIGYKEFFNYFNNNASLDEICELISKNSRNYAKRQLTWFRKMPNLKWFDCVDHAKNYLEDI